jgi:transcriptional regulator with XRE-family HTH domain
MSQTQKQFRRAEGGAHMHPGPRFRVRREKIAISLTEVAYRIRVDSSRLSRYERAQADLRPDEQQRLEDALAAAARARARALQEAMAQDHFAV